MQATTYPTQPAVRFIGTKLIRAEPMTRGFYNAFRGWTMPPDEQAEEPGPRRVLKGFPHVDSQTLNMGTVFELIQPARHQGLVAVGQHVDWNPIDHVGDDAPELAVDLRLIHADPLGQPGLVLGIELLDVLTRDGADGLVVAANMLGHAHEGIAQALGLYVLDAPLRHAHGAVQACQWLNEGAGAVAALIPLRPRQDAYVLPPDGTIADGDGLGAVSIQVANDPTPRANIGKNGVLSFDFVFIAVEAGFQGFPALKVKNVGHLIVGFQPQSGGLEFISGTMSASGFSVSGFLDGDVFVMPAWVRAPQRRLRLGHVVRALIGPVSSGGYASCNKGGWGLASEARRGVFLVLQYGDIESAAVREVLTQPGIEIHLLLLFHTIIRFKEYTCIPRIPHLIPQSPFCHGTEAIDFDGDAWKERQGGRRLMKKRRRFKPERRSGWDRRARAAMAPGPGWWPAMPAAVR